MIRPWLFLCGKLWRYESAASFGLVFVFFVRLLAFVWLFLRWKGDRRCVKSSEIAAFAAGNIFVGCEETVQRLFHDLLLFNCPCLTQRNTYLSSKMMSKCVSRWYTVSFPLMIIVEVGAFTHCISFTLMMVVWLGGVAVWPFQLMTFGFFLCVDAFLYVFTLLPLRVLLAVLRLLTLPCCGFRSEPKHTLSYL